MLCLSERSSVAVQHTRVVLGMITILTREDGICDEFTNDFPAVTFTNILMHFEAVQNLETMKITQTDF